MSEELKKHEESHENYSVIKMIEKLVMEFPNDQELGKEVRKLMNELQNKL